MFYAEFGASPAKLTIRVSKITSDSIAFNVSVTIEGYGFEYPIFVLRKTVIEFAERLRTMHAALSGSCWLSEVGGGTLCAYVGNEGRGRIIFGGKYTLYPPTEHKVAKEPQFLRVGFRQGVEINFDGIETDQSYIPDFLQQLVSLIAARSEDYED